MLRDSHNWNSEIRCDVVARFYVNKSPLTLQRASNKSQPGIKHVYAHTDDESLSSGIRELNMFEALMCFITICTKYNAPLASVNGDSDDDRYDIVGCGAAGQPATGPLGRASRMERG